ncbi:MAG TPA: hypothetical protein VMD91_11285 [Candidatus Sulfotelmatobacter sp.]|nr:hypothetical protein [Candidatus Sulfotelmatobacter sp.]
MERRNVITDSTDNGSSLAMFSLIAVVVVAALIGLFVWQPWTTRTSSSTTTTVTTPAGGANSGTAAGGTSGAGGSSSTNGGSH